MAEVVESLRWTVVVQRTDEPKSRMRESRTSGSVGVLGGQLPEATRPAREG